jgi:hypothetical protein
MRYVPIALCLTLLSCAAIRNDLNKFALLREPLHFTLIHDIPFIIDPEIYMEGDELYFGGLIDERLTKYSDCLTDLGIQSRIDLLRRVPVIIVEEGFFKCDFHAGFCSGEYDPTKDVPNFVDRGVMYVAQFAFGHDREIPLYEHECGHANGTLAPDHSNIKETEVCFDN